MGCGAIAPLQKAAIAGGNASQREMGGIASIIALSKGYRHPGWMGWGVKLVDRSVAVAL